MELAIKIILMCEDGSFHLYRDFVASKISQKTKTKPNPAELAQPIDLIGHEVNRSGGHLIWMEHPEVNEMSSKSKSLWV
jgi:hypothetical protein